jgi:hypothetical protein
MSNEYTISKRFEVRGYHLTSGDAAFLAILLKDYQEQMKRLKNDALTTVFSQGYLQREIDDAGRLANLLGGE